MEEVVAYSVEDNYDIELSVTDAARKHFNDGDYDKAIQLYSGLLKSSASSKLYFDVGLCYYKKKKYEIAIEHLKHSVSMDIDNSIAYSYLGNCYFKLLDAKNAIESWHKSRISNPKDAQVCLNLAIAYFVKNMHYESVCYYEKYLKYAINKENEQYKSIYNNITANRQIAEDSYIQANRNRSRSFAAEAEKEYKSAVKKYPADSRYHLGLADFYYDMHDYSNAAFYYKYALRSPDFRNKENYLKLAQSLEHINDLRLAYCYYKRTIQYTISEPKEQLQMMQKINELKKHTDDSIYDISYTLAKQYYEDNDYYNALSEYENCVYINPSSKNEFNEIISQLKGFIDTESIVSKKYMIKGKELLEKGNISNANKYFTQVMQISNPKSNIFRLAKSKLVNV